MTKTLKLSGKMLTIKIETSSYEIDNIEAYLIDCHGWTQDDCSAFTTDELQGIIKRNGWTPTYEAYNV